MTYDPRLVRFRKLSGAAMVGWTLQTGVSRVGQVDDTRTDIYVSSISLTDGYTTGENGELSVDPLTGSASMSERFRPGIGESVITRVAPPLGRGDRFEITYDDVTVAMGTIFKNPTVSMVAENMYWVRKTSYVLSGVASQMLSNTVEWDYLDEEPALTRLQRHFEVNTSLLSTAMIAYLSTTLMPPRDLGSSTYLDLARDFSAVTRFPVRPLLFPASWDRLDIVPAVNFDGVTPPAAVTDIDQWSGSADFEVEPNGIKPISVGVKRNYTGFLGGFNTQPLAGSPVGEFQVNTTRIGESYQIPIGFQTPAIVDVFGTPLVATRVQHEFTSETYVSQLELAAPVEI